MNYSGKIVNKQLKEFVYAYSAVQGKQFNVFTSINDLKRTSGFSLDIRIVFKIYWDWG